jgi:hypothetical protein
MNICEKWLFTTYTSYGKILPKECMKLQTYLDEKSLQEKQYRDRIERAGGKPNSGGYF